MATCPHGFSTDECMICRTLGVSTTAAPQPGGGRRARRSRTAVATAVPASVVPADATRTSELTGRRAEGATQGSARGRGLLALLGVIVVAGLLLWAFTGLFSLAFHVGEFVAVALVAGWAGYRIGHFQGRRGR